MQNLFDAGLFASSIRIMTPVLLAALGGLMCTRASVFNIALEGFMLSGSFFAILVVDKVGNPWVGLLGGILAGLLMSLLYGLFVLKYNANAIIVGIAINIGALGLTTYLLKAIYGVSGVYRPASIEALPALEIPFIKDIPFIGTVLSGHTPVIYISFVLVVVTFILLFKTPFGLAVRSVGENPDTVRTAGINPKLVQLLTILWSGALCGLAGAHLSTGYVFEFSENMTQGRGFTAFTAMVFGASHPVWTMIASFLFGFADALGYRLQLQNIGIPPKFIQMFPYFLAIAVLTISSIVRKRQRSASSEI
ncbi:MAG: ABC transporter permease [Anaerolineaceae bacterium]|jgi:Uncharacterized ABC-type transport system, permease component